MSSTAIDKSMELLYVGNPVDDESIGLAEQLVRGLGASAGAGGIDNFCRSGGTVLVIKLELHCLGEGKKRIVVGGNSGGPLTLPMMLAANLADKVDAKGIRGRSLHARTKDVVRNCKKAPTIVICHNSPYKACATTGMLPSGMSFEDYLHFVRKEMYTELRVSVRSSELVEVDIRRRILLLACSTCVYLYTLIFDCFTVLDHLFHDCNKIVMA